MSDGTRVLDSGATETSNSLSTCCRGPVPRARCRPTRCPTRRGTSRDTWHRSRNGSRKSDMSGSTGTRGALATDVRANDTGEPLVGCVSTTVRGWLAGTTRSRDRVENLRCQHDNSVGFQFDRICILEKYFLLFHYGLLEKSDNTIILFYLNIQSIIHIFSGRSGCPQLFRLVWPRHCPRSQTFC